MKLTRTRALCALAVALPLLAYVVYPVAAMLADAFSLPVLGFRARQLDWDPKAQPFGAGIIAAWHEPLAWRAAWGTLKLSILTVFTAGAWGLWLALLWNRRAFPGRRFFALLGYSPVLMPPLVGTLAFYRLIGDAGVLWRAWPGGQELIGPFGALLILHTYAFGLYTYAFVAAALENLDPSLEEAARSLGGSNFAVFRHAVWPTIRAPLSAAALLTFMAAGASYSGPLILHNAGQYLTVEIVSQAGDRGLQAALTAVLAVLSIAALPAFLYFQARADKSGAAAPGAGLKGTAARPLAPALGSARTWRLLQSIAAASVLLAPPLMVVLGTFAEPASWSKTVLPEAYHAGGFSQLGGEDWQALWHSIEYGAAAALLVMAVALAVSLALRRAPWWSALPAEGAVMLAVALPGTAVGIALLAAFNGPSWIFAGAELGGTAGILILAYAVRNLPLAVRPTRAALAGLGDELEQDARSLGATPARVLVRIVLPLLLPSLLAAGMLCFLAGAGEFVASELLFAPETVPASVRILQNYRENFDRATALSLCLMALSGVAVALAGWIQARFSWRNRSARASR